MILSFQEGETVLHVAATSGQLETVEALLDRGCDANVQDFVSIVLIPKCWKTRQLKMEDDLYTRKDL